jgi:hypothetical protein
MKYTIRRARRTTVAVTLSVRPAADVRCCLRIQRHLTLKWSILAYTASSYVAMSRLHDNGHYAMSFLCGPRNCCRTQRYAPWEFELRFPVAVPRGGGLALVYSRREMKVSASQCNHRGRNQVS